jgi:hypothetical protein
MIIKTIILGLAVTSQQLIASDVDFDGHVRLIGVDARPDIEEFFGSLRLREFPDIYCDGHGYCYNKGTLKQILGDNAAFICRDEGICELNAPRNPDGIEIGPEYIEADFATLFSARDVAKVAAALEDRGGILRDGSTVLSCSSAANCKLRAEVEKIGCKGVPRPTELDIPAGKITIRNDLAREMYQNLNVPARETPDGVIKEIPLSMENPEDRFYCQMTGEEHRCVFETKPGSSEYFNLTEDEEKSAVIDALAIGVGAEKLGGVGGYNILYRHPSGFFDIRCSGNRSTDLVAKTCSAQFYTNPTVCGFRI